MSDIAEMEVKKASWWNLPALVTPRELNSQLHLQYKAHLINLVVWNVLSFSSQRLLLHPTALSPQQGSIIHVALIVYISSFHFITNTFYTSVFLIMLCRDSILLFFLILTFSIWLSTWVLKWMSEWMAGWWDGYHAMWFQKCWPTQITAAAFAQGGWKKLNVMTKQMRPVFVMLLVSC